MDATASQIYDPRQLDKYDYHEEPGPIRRLLWFCAGADPELLRHCPDSERVKEEGIGGIVLATALLAFLSGTYAMYVVFGPKVGLALSAEQQAIDGFALFKAIAVGAVWGLIILNLDRFVVSSTGHGDGTDAITWSEFGRAIPRIIMAVIIGLCLSAPLELRVMKSEIEAELRNRQNEYVAKLDQDFEKSKFSEQVKFLETGKADAEAKIRKITDDLQKREAVIIAQRKRLDDEAAGKTANGRAGEGPAFKAAMRNLEELKEEFSRTSARATEEIAQLKAEVQKSADEMSQARKLRDDKRAEHRVAATNMDGIITRVHIAHDIGGWSFWILSFVLMIIEIAPIFFKMMMPKGPYLSLQENQNQMVLARYGIVTESRLKPGSRTTMETIEHYQRAETIRDFEVKQLEAERHLAEVARNKFIEVASEEIRNHPENFMDLPKRIDPPAPKSS